MPKPKNKKKKFIDRKNESSVTFKLIHRGQKDPLAADEDAPQRVLQIVSNPNLEKQKAEQREHGIFFEDDYNYLQHLKDPKDQGKDFSALDRFLIEAKDTNVKLPPSVFPSNVEEEVGLLNKAAPRKGPLLDWDPDIVAGLDEDFDFENPDNQLDDNFMEMANAEGEDLQEEEEEDDHYFDTDEERDEVGSLENFSDEETKSRFTNYSMSSSIIRRNEGLKFLDDRFENFYAEYDDMNIGSLACDDIEGIRPEASDMMENIVQEFNKQKEEERVKPQFDNTYAFMNEDEDDVDDLKKDFERVQVAEDDKWDCETILSTYSNIYNHPKLISERKVVDPIKISGKTGMPKDVLGKGLTASALKRFDALNGGGEVEKPTETMTHASRVSELSFRNKHETREEKLARKEGMKEYKRERRIERKANREAFRNEKVRQEKIQHNNRSNQQGIKLI